MTAYKKILVVCVGNMVTGGPEALHHLVHCMRTLGLPAYICYHPFDKSFEVPAAYREFDVAIAPFEDKADYLIVFPEVHPMEALRIRQAQAAIWWLSLDNFLERRHTSPLHDRVRYLKRALQGRRPFAGIQAMKRLIHFSQSHYASEYLKQQDIPCTEFFEPINARFLDPRLDTGAQNRVDEVLFNPSKGMKITQQLMARNPGITFTPLKGFDREQLTKKFQTAKAYIDFGHHPGRDRLPREAAIHGCCLITGQLGSAANEVDIPIPQAYKLDQNSADFIDRFNTLLADIFRDFAQHHQAFNDYRKRILGESAVFEAQIKAFFLGPADKPSLNPATRMQHK